MPFQNTCVLTLDIHAPIMKKILRFNENSFMTKAVRKTVMHKSKLKKMYIINLRLMKTELAIKSKEISV